MASGGNQRRATSSAGHPDWPNLPHELLLIIAEICATTVSDYICFRSVCRSWRSAAAPAFLRPHLPLLMLPSDANSDFRHFYSLSADKTFAVSLPEVRGKAVLHSAGGWLLLYEPCYRAGLQELSLLNPVSRAQFRLPSTSGFRDNKNLKVWSSFLYCKPNSGVADCVVMLSNCRPGGEIFFCRGGDTAWILLETGLGDGEMIATMAYFDGRVFVITQKGKISIYDPAISLQLAVMEISSVGTLFTSFHLVMTAAKLLLLVGQSHPGEDGRKRESFVAFKLHYSDGFLREEQVCGIEDAAAFLSNHQLMLVPAKEIPGCKGNHIYSSHFFDLHYHRDLERVMDVQGIWLLNLENANYQVEHMSCNWIIPLGSVYEPRLILQPQRHAFALRHRFPLSRWVGLNLA